MCVSENIEMKLQQEYWKDIVKQSDHFLNI